MTKPTAGEIAKLRAWCVMTCAAHQGMAIAPVVQELLERQRLLERAMNHAIARLPPERARDYERSPEWRALARHDRGQEPGGG